MNWRQRWVHARFWAITKLAGDDLSVAVNVDVRGHLMFGDRWGMARNITAYPIEEGNEWHERWTFLGGSDDLR